MENLKEYIENKMQEVFKFVEYPYSVNVMKAVSDNGIEQIDGYGIFITLENGKKLSRFVSTKKQVFEYAKEIDERLGNYNCSDLELVDRMLNELFF
jgi:hypothetical protein